MLATTLEKLREEGIREGIEKGIKRGRKEKLVKLIRIYFVGSISLVERQKVVTC